MKGMPTLYYVTGGQHQTRWVGHNLVVSSEADEVRRLYQYEDAAPEASAATQASVRSAPRLARIRQLLGASGA